MTDTFVRLEAVYYSSPVIRSLEALTVLGLVFDRIHLPFVSLPDDGFTIDDLEARAKGLIALKPTPMSNTALMVAALQFTQWKEWTKDFLYYPHSQDDIWRAMDNVQQELVREIYDLTFPQRPGWTPTFDSAHAFGVAPGGGGASIAYAGSFHYPAAALTYASEVGLPLINDVPMLGIPRVSPASFKNNASALTSVLAVECVQFMLPQIPLMDITELLDFRDEMKPHVQVFRTNLLRLAKSVNNQITAGAAAEDVSAAARFVVESEIQPLVIEMKAFAESPKRSWHQRLIALGKPLTAMLGGEFWSVPPGMQFYNIARGYAEQAIAARASDREREEVLKRSPMYYLLQVQKLGDGK